MVKLKLFCLRKFLYEGYELLLHCRGASAYIIYNYFVIGLCVGKVNGGQVKVEFECSINAENPSSACCARWHAVSLESPLGSQYTIIESPLQCTAHRLSCEAASHDAAFPAAQYENVVLL